MTLSQDAILENRYRIEQLLGQGGMGAIYRGYDLKLDIPVALKENFFQTEQSIRQFQQEARILARLHHPNLPRVIDHFSFEGRQYLVMDFVEGRDLWELVNKQPKQPLPEKQALDYLIQVCDAVSYLHRQNPPIIHRDIKPQNIKVTPQDRAVLVDFGIAKIAEEDSQTSTGARGVTPGFSPPEQYSGAGTTPASDLYALGATLYAILTGQKPPDSISLITGAAKFKLPNEINAKLNPQVSRIIGQAMQVQQADRPASVAVWQQDLTAILESTTEPDRTPEQATVLASTRKQPLPKEASALPSGSAAGTRPDSPPTSGSRRILIVVSAIALGVAGVVGYLTFSASSAPVPPAESSPVTAPVIESEREPSPTEAEAATVTAATTTPEQVPTQTLTSEPVHNTGASPPAPTLSPTSGPEPAELSIPAGKGALTMFNCFADTVNVEVTPAGVFQTLAPKTGPNCEPGDPIFLDPGEYMLRATFADRASEGTATIFIEAGGILNFEWQ